MDVWQQLATNKGKLFCNVDNPGAYNFVVVGTGTFKSVLSAKLTKNLPESFVEVLDQGEDCYNSSHAMDNDRFLVAQLSTNMVFGQV